MNNRNVQHAGTAKRTAVIAIATVLLIIAVAVFGWLSQRRQNVPQATFAPNGELIAGFPKDLILDPAAVVGKSYTIGYSGSLNQYTATWISSSSVGSLYTAYLGYFASHGWTITNSSTNLAAFRGVYAVTSTADANVVMDVSAKGGTKVTISYVAVK